MYEGKLRIVRQWWAPRGDLIDEGLADVARQPLHRPQRARLATSFFLIPTGRVVEVGAR